MDQHYCNAAQKALRIKAFQVWRVQQYTIISLHKRRYKNMTVAIIDEFHQKTSILSKKKSKPLMLYYPAILRVTVPTYSNNA